MNTPFPGMDPHLEHPARYGDVNLSLAVAIADYLAPIIAPKYYTSVPHTTFVINPLQRELKETSDAVFISSESAPVDMGLERDGAAVFEVFNPSNDEIKQRRIEICETGTDRVITRIELLRPVIKMNRDGRYFLLRNREQCLDAQINIIEIDLLRAGTPLPLINPIPLSDYRITIICWRSRFIAQVLAFNLRALIPDFPVPLMQNDEETTVQLNDLMHRIYSQSRFDLRIDYATQPVPPLSNEDWMWAQSLTA